MDYVTKRSIDRLRTINPGTKHAAPLLPRRQAASNYASRTYLRGSTMAENYRCCAFAARQGEDIAECEAELLNTMVENGLTLRQIVPVMQHFKHCRAENRKMPVAWRVRVIT